jgi:hypothetical protein
MATISNVTLAYGANTATHTSVTVAGTLGFDAADVGRTYQLRIALVGEDKAGDTLPSGDAVGDDVLQEFSFAGTPLPKLFRTIQVSAAGSQNFSETRNVLTTRLDEDPGKVSVGPPPSINDPPLQMPRADEVYARVTLQQPAITARSATRVSIGV